MRRPTYVVELSEEERARLETLIRKGKSSARKQTRARILLKANAGLLSQEIEQALNVSDEMVYRARQRFVEEGLEAALNDRPRPGTKPKLMDKQCAHLIAVACSGGTATGRCGCWPTRRWSWDSRNRSAMKRCGTCSKKLPQAVAKGAMVHHRK